jgi:hypothetical protein
MNEGFVVHLGGGLYLDSGGGITTGPQTPSTQVYKGAGGLKLDTDKISKTLKDIADFLEDDKTKEKIRKLGLSEKTLQVVLQAAGIGAAAAGAASVAFIALGVALALIGELTKESGIAPELASVLQGIKDDIKAIDDRLISDKIVSVRDNFHDTATDIRTALQEIVVQKLKGAARIAKFAEIQTEVKDLGPSLSALLTQDWSPLFRLDDYKEIFSLSIWLSKRDPNGAYVPFVMSSTVRRFDYRLGVPIFAYVSTAYPVLVAAGMPWFRSTGSHALRMRDLATAIDAFVTRMYSECLAKTIHTAQSMFQSEGRVPTMTPHFLPLASPLSLRRTTWDDEYLVGAVDLVRYTDAWFSADFSKQLTDLGYDTGHRGAFDFSWPRDARTRVVLDDNTVKEANEHSEQALADLQVASGMVHLMTAAARLRFLSTPPITSETVSGTTTGHRRLTTEEPTTAKSPWIFPTGQIERPATLQHFEARARASVSTQAPGYPFSFNYRVRLVTVESQRGDAWDDAGYSGNIYKSSYVPASDPRDQRLDVQIDRQRLLTSRVLFEGPSPPSPINLHDTLTMKASTFDWYVPTREYLLPYEPTVTVAGIKALATQSSSGQSSSKWRTGATSVHLLKPPPPAGTGNTGGSTGANFLNQPFRVEGPLDNSVLDEISGFESADQLVKEGGERRWAKQETVEIAWTLSWRDGELIVTVSGRPQDRACQIWLIIEEDIYSGESLPTGIEDILADDRLRTELHSAFPLEVVNQLVVVPKEFFQAEREAMAFGEKLWHDLNDRFAKSREVGRQPPSPIEFQRRLIQVLGDTPSTAGLAERQNRRFAFIREHVPEALEAVLRDHEVNLESVRGLDGFR